MNCINVSPQHIDSHSIAMPIHLILARATNEPTPGGATARCRFDNRHPNETTFTFESLEPKSLFFSSLFFSFTISFSVFTLCQLNRTGKMRREKGKNVHWEAEGASLALQKKRRKKRARVMCTVRDMKFYGPAQLMHFSRQASNYLIRNFFRSRRFSGIDGIEKPQWSPLRQPVEKSMHRLSGVSVPFFASDTGSASSFIFALIYKSIMYSWDAVNGFSSDFSSESHQRRTMSN